MVGVVSIWVVSYHSSIGVHYLGYLLLHFLGIGPSILNNIFSLSDMMFACEEEFLKTLLLVLSDKLLEVT